MPVQTNLLVNCDDALLFWKVAAPIPDCLGFAIDRERKLPNGTVSATVIDNRVGFKVDNPKAESIGPRRNGPEGPRRQQQQREACEDEEFGGRRLVHAHKGQGNFSGNASTANDESFVIARGNQELAASSAAHIMGVYDHYRWLAFLGERQDRKDSKSLTGCLSESDAWLSRKLNSSARELKFWVR